MLVIQAWKWSWRCARWQQGAWRRVAGVLAAVAISILSAAQVGAAPDSAAVKLVVLGDSLSAGYQLAASDAFPAKLQKALRAKGFAVSVANAGVSGDTASDGLDRIDWSVPEGTDAVLVELGANDALRGIDPSVTRKALQGILQRLKQRGIAILLCGMLAPRNLGQAYDQAFDGIYPELSAAENVPLYPFFLDGVATDPALNLADGMHPNPAGVDVIVARILPAVEKLIAPLGARSAQ